MLNRENGVRTRDNEGFVARGMQLNCQHKMVFVLRKSIVILKLIALIYRARARTRALPLILSWAKIILTRCFTTSPRLSLSKIPDRFQRVLCEIRHGNSVAKIFSGNVHSWIVIVRVRRALIEMCSQLRERKPNSAIFFTTPLGRYV